MSYKFLRVQRLAMLFIGKWEINWENKFPNKLYKIYSWIAHIYFIGILQSMPFIIISRWGCGDIIWKIGSIYIIHINTFIIALLSNSNNMKQVISYIINYENSEYPKEMHLTQKTYDSCCKLHFNIGLFGIVCTTQFAAIGYYIFEATFTFWEDDNDICALQKGLVYQFWLPFDIEKYYWIALMFEIWEMSLGGTYHSYNKLVPISVSTFQLGQIKMLQETLRHLDEEAKDLHETKNIELGQAVDILINKCAKKLQDIISLMDLLHQATGPIMLIEFFTNIVETAVFLIRMLTAETVSEGLITVGVSCTVFIQQLIFFWQANEVYLESQRIIDVIYNETNWYSYKVSVQKKIIIMMLECQKPLSFEAIGVGPMTLETFKQILKSCYSIVTFFKTVYN